MSASTGIPVGVAAGGATEVEVGLGGASEVGLGSTVAKRGVAPTVAVGEGWTVAVGEGWTVAVGEGWTVAVGEGSKVAVGEGSTMAVGFKGTVLGVASPPQPMMATTAVNAMAETNKRLPIDAMPTTTPRSRMIDRFPDTTYFQNIVTSSRPRTTILHSNAVKDPPTRTILWASNHADRRYIPAGPWPARLPGL